MHPLEIMLLSAIPFLAAVTYYELKLREKKEDGFLDHFGRSTDDDF